MARRPVKKATKQIVLEPEVNEEVVYAAIKHQAQRENYAHTLNLVLDRVVSQAYENGFNSALWNRNNV